MKKYVILVFLMLSGGLAQSVKAQCYPAHPARPTIFILDYRSCGTPIYAKRVYRGGCWQIVRVDQCEIRHLRARQRTRAVQRAHQRHLIHHPVRRARFYRHQPSRRRCR